MRARNVVQKLAVRIFIGLLSYHGSFNFKINFALGTNSKGKLLKLLRQEISKLFQPAVCYGYLHALGKDGISEFVKNANIY